MDFKKKLEDIIVRIYKTAGYTLDKEVLDVLLSDDQHRLISAPAGGTKTTLTQLIVVIEKLRFLVEGSKINMGIKSNIDRVETIIPKEKLLCLVYNNHNVGDIDGVHAKFYNMLVGMKLISPSPAARNFVEPGVNSCTLHSYSTTLIKENLRILKLKEFNLAKDTVLKAQFRSVVEKVLQDSSVDITSSVISDAKRLYDLYVGLKLYETPEDQPLINSVEFELALQNALVPLKYLREIFLNYDKRKKMMKLYEYSDQLRLADDLLKIPEIKEEYSNKFHLIIADEVQDFTPLMFSIRKALVGPNTKTVTVGDSDQGIYSFLGALSDSIDNYQNYTNHEYTKFNLTVNRRCKLETMPFALNVINSVEGRTVKEIKTTKLGGTLERIPYRDVAEQVEKTLELIYKNVSGTTGILFRNKNQSIILSRFLYDRNIQANYINAHNCMEHRLYTVFIELINEAFINKTQRGLTMLNRVLPFNKQALEDFFQFDKKTGVSAKCPEAYSWGNIDFKPLYENSRRFHSIDKQVEFIKNVAKNSSTIIASDCIEEMLDMFYQNYFSYLTESQEDPYIELILQWAKKDLSVGYNLLTAVTNLKKDIIKYMGRGRHVGKLNICTIHGTKGLEFNHTILNLEKEKVVNGNMLSARAIKYQEAEDARLTYVGATRQIDSLTVLCSTEHVHRFSDESFFESIETAPLEKQFTTEKPKIFEDELAISKPRRVRRSMLLED